MLCRQNLTSDIGGQQHWVYLKVGAMITDENIRYVVWKAANLLHQKCQNEEVYLYQYRDRVQDATQ